MGLVRIDCPHCGELVKIRISLDSHRVMDLVRGSVLVADKRNKAPKFRSFSELFLLCGEDLVGCDHQFFRRCVTTLVHQGFLERRNIRRRWKFRMLSKFHVKRDIQNRGLSARGGVQGADGRFVSNGSLDDGGVGVGDSGAEDS